MGAWGPAIFSDDTACDIRSEYRELIEDQIPDADATQQILAHYNDLPDDEAHVLWLALAACQSSLGRLDAEVKSRALEIIDTGQGLELWEEAGPKELAKRKAALAKLRDHLEAPQPARKLLRRPWREVSDLCAGDVLSFAASNGTTALLRVLRVDDDRVGAAPILALLDWTGRSVPARWRLRRLKVRQSTTPGMKGGPLRPDTYRVMRPRKKSPDWNANGFAIAARVDPRPEDENAQARTYLSWESLKEELERLLCV